MCLLLALWGCAAPPANQAGAYVPAQWTEFVRTEGQSEPVPVQWLKDEEARFAHSLQLPAAVPRPVPFDFDAGPWGKAGYDKRSPRVRYFDHLCATEAGEWIFRKEKNVEGLYFARPQPRLSGDEMTDPLAPEAPWIQRLFYLKSDSLEDQSAWFIDPPVYDYRFIEQPRRPTRWQEGIETPYVRLFGYTRGYFVKPGQTSRAWNMLTPMQVAGIAERKARYGYTWRGIRRVRDREFGIAGGELIIYELATREVLAVRRQFLIAGANPRGQGRAMWELAASCRELRSRDDTGEMRKFAFRVIEPVVLSDEMRKYL